MSTIEVAVAGRGIQVKQGYEKPSAGDVNTCAVSLAIESGGVWDSLPHKRVTFSTRTASVTVDYAPTITIPHEVMASPGALYLTLTGYDANGIEVARTHRMTYPIEVARAGADEGAEPSPATLDVVSRIDALAADLEEKRDTDYWRGEPGEPGADGYSPTANVTKDGGTATITVTDKNGTTTATVSDGAPGSDASATDVRINGTSITVDGVADIPAAKANTLGLFKSHPDYGFYYGLDNNIFIQHADSTNIDARSNSYQPITPSNLDYAVKAAMTDGKGAAWTADEQQAARERMNAADANKVYIMQKQIENLQGIAATEETDSTEAYTKTVPTGAQKWASLDKVGGKTVVWNQQYEPYIKTYHSFGINSTANDDGTMDVIGTVDVTNYGFFGLIPTKNEIIRDGRKYLMLCNNNFGGRKMTVYGFNTQFIDGAAIFSDTSGGTWRTVVGVYADKGVVINEKNVMVSVIELTKLFGAGNEPATLDDPRIAFIKAYAELHPEYNPGELMSAEVVEVESKGKNIISLEPVEKGGGFYNMEVGKKLMNGLYGDRVSCDSTDLTAKVTTAYDWVGVCFLSDRLVSGADYKLSFEANAVTSLAASMYAVDEGQVIKKVYQNTRQLDYKTSTTLTVPADATRIAVTIGGASSSGDVLNITKLQLEKGTVATDYKPYGVKETFPIPQSVRNLCPGYGWSAGTVCNEIDFGRKVYVQRVGSVDLGTLDWLYDSAKKIFFSAPVLGIYKHTDDSAVPKWLCANYVTSSFNAIRDDGSIKQNMAMGQGFEAALGANCQCIRDDSYSDAAAFKAAMSGVLLYYELAEPIEVDLSDVLTDDHYIEVEAGGTVTFKQASTQLPVPSSVTYQISTSEVIANA